MTDKITIINCPACAGKVSSAASSCPHCGHPIKEPEKPQLTPPSAEDKTNQTGRLIKTISALMMVAGIIGAVAGSGFGAGLLILGFFGFVVGRFMD
jgi:hypothetical protein